MKTPTKFLPTQKCMSNNNLKFSIIIPSYNESDDVRLSIESAINQSYKDREILVIDDSSDNTPEIIKEYGAEGVKLVDGQRKGCCGARNLGMKTASGDVVVLLNGDVVLPPNFLEKLKSHYENGAGYILVESKIFNLENFWARYVEMLHRHEYWNNENIEWTEGFSCRRDAAINVGLIPGDFSVRFCRDWFFGRKLKEAGYKKVIDRSIIVTHKAPDNFPEYWRVRKARGRFGALTQYFLLEKNKAFLFFKFFIKDILTALYFLLIFPAVFKVFRISCHSEKSCKDFFPFLYAYFIQRLSFIIGEWEGFRMFT